MMGKERVGITFTLIKAHHSHTPLSPALLAHLYSYQLSRIQSLNMIVSPRGESMNTCDNMARTRVVVIVHPQLIQSQQTTPLLVSVSFN